MCRDLGLKPELDTIFRRHSVQSIPTLFLQNQRDVRDAVAHVRNVRNVNAKSIMIKDFNGWAKTLYQTPEERVQRFTYVKKILTQSFLKEIIKFYMKSIWKVYRTSLYRT